MTGIGNFTPFQINDSGVVVGVSGSSGKIYQNGTLTDMGGLPQPAPDFGQGNSSAAGVNSSGAVAGWSLLGPSAYSVTYSNGSLSQLPNPPAVSISYSGAAAINDSGTFVVSFASTDGKHAFAYSNGNYTDIGRVGGLNSAANAINNSGVVVEERHQPSWVSGISPAVGHSATRQV